MELRLLTERDFPMIHETFLEAFADYAVPVDFDADRLRRMMVRRGTDFTASVGAFDGERMVAVMATGVRDYEGIPSAYDTFTGVRPEARGQRLAGRMFDVAREELQGRGIARFVLEVLQSNTEAIKAYSRAGFATRRNFDCYEVRTGSLEELAVPEELEIRYPETLDRELWAGWRDWTPSWQNSDDSIAHSIEEVVLIEAWMAGRPVGGAAVVPQARDLPQLAIEAESRRLGVGATLLAEAARQIEPGKALRIINIDAASEPDTAFFGTIGDSLLPSQFEMVLEF